MALLLSYLKKHWTLVSLALVLAAINQIFSLLDPLIFRHIIDQYATKFHQYTTGQFIRGVSVLLGAAVGVAQRDEAGALGDLERSAWERCGNVGGDSASSAHSRSASRMP